jgi:hypothetical protein
VKGGSIQHRSAIEFATLVRWKANRARSFVHGIAGPRETDTMRAPARQDGAHRNFRLPFVFGGVRYFAVTREGEPPGSREGSEFD